MGYIVPPLINEQYKKRLDGFRNDKNESPTTHGGAKWQTHNDLVGGPPTDIHGNPIAKTGNPLIGDTGIPLGLSTPSWFPVTVRQNDERNPIKIDTIRYTGKKHLVTIAPSGSGKGTDVQIPVLLEHDASIFMIDPKGENAIITADYRKTVLKQDVFILNPFGVLAEKFEERSLTCHGFNPLATLSEGINFVADVSALSEALIVTEGNDPYWSNAARELISCLIMFVCTQVKNPKERNLKKVRELLTQSEENLLSSLAEIVKDTENFQPMRQKAILFTNSSKGTASIISTAITQTSFLDDPCLSENLCQNDFSFMDLKDKPTTIFLVLPARFMVAYSKWFRLLITSALDTLMSTHKKSEKPVLFMLDECATIGYLPCIETAVGLARGYGIQIWSFFQDIHQLKDIYRNRAESFLANAGVQQYFTPNDTELAERISKRVGNTTVKVTSTSISDGQSNSPYGSNSQQRGTANSTSEVGVMLIQPADILGMDSKGQIVFFEGNGNPVYLSKNTYHLPCSIYSQEDRYQDNPYF
jgi:type IV secretion system protein VirD4